MMEKLTVASHESSNQTHQKQNHENEKQHLRDAGSTGGNTTESEQRGDNGDDKKDCGVIKHDGTPCVERDTRNLTQMKYFQIRIAVLPVKITRVA
jgi:hypothetical protein